MIWESGDVRMVCAATLSDHKRLRGGVALVAAAELPRTHSGKLNRLLARDLFAALQLQGRCL
jgi:acyl-coenzyme A synthetase/AMP-(fatty) acid ligase